jgi:hypothetical protein
MSTAKNEILTSIAETIEIPESAYKAAEDRYKDLGAFLTDPGSHSHNYDPHIFAQGSFRLGTVIRPLSDDEEYDLDLSCELKRGYSPQQRSQRDLKHLLGLDLEKYRVARRIENMKEEKNRCWRLRYKDQLRFHMDVVPCLPESAAQKLMIKDAMVRFGSAEALAKAVAEFSVNITDRTSKHYAVISGEWPISNPEGYARWLESRMKLATAVLERRVHEAKAASIDKLPAYRWKTPLQLAIQLLKRHRDVMFNANPDVKAISIIITTLAGHAYNGEIEIADALERILGSMELLISATTPRVPNPVNPAEDFADKWDTVEGRRLQLERNFRMWVAQARADFRVISGSTSADFIVKQATARLKVDLDEESLRRKLGTGFPNVVKNVVVTEAPARPWAW